MAPAPPSSVLVVEDEWLIGEMLQLCLEDAGYCVVGPARSVREARAIIADATVHAAVLDVNLGPETTLELADELIASGTPVLLTTGYTGKDLPPRFRDCRLLIKPIQEQKLIEVLMEMIAQ